MVTSPSPPAPPLCWDQPFSASSFFSTKGVTSVNPLHYTWERLRHWEYLSLPSPGPGGIPLICGQRPKAGSGKGGRTIIPHRATRPPLHFAACPLQTPGPKGATMFLSFCKDRGALSAHHTSGGGDLEQPTQPAVKKEPGSHRRIDTLENLKKRKRFPTATCPGREGGDYCRI